LNLIFKLDLK